MTEQQLASFLAFVRATAIKGAKTQQRRDYWACVFTISAFTGLRASELLSLAWGDVDLEKGIGHLSRHQAKGDRERSFLILPKAKAALFELQQLRGVPGPEEKIVKQGYDSFRQVFDRWQKAYFEGQSHTTLHRLREYFIRHCLSVERMDVHTVSRTAGARITTIDKHYAEMNQEDHIQNVAREVHARAMVYGSEAQ